MYTTRARMKGTPEGARSATGVGAAEARVRRQARPQSLFGVVPEPAEPEPLPLLSPRRAPLPSQALRTDEPPTERRRTPQPLQFDPRQALGWAMAGKWLIIAGLILGAVAAYAVVKSIPPRFASYADLIIGPPPSQIAPDATEAPPVYRDTQLLEMDSRFRMLTSTNVLGRAVDTLNLQNDPEFAGRGRSLPFLGRSSSDEAGNPRLTALRNLYEQVSAERGSQSYVATLAVYTREPEKSVRIADAIVAAFQEEIWQSDRDQSGMAVGALNDRLADLRERANRAAAAVETFRRERNLESIDGELLPTQSLGQLNTQINDARAALIGAESRLADLRAGRNASLTARNTGDSRSIAALRTQLSELQGEFESRSAVYGPLHPTITALRPQLRAAENALRQEIERAIRAAEEEAGQARSVVAQLTEQSNSVRTTVSQDNSALVQLRELQREAGVQAAIYEAYMRRMAEIDERRQVEVTNIRVISPPLPAVSRSWPPRAMVMIPMGAAIGAMLGLLAALALGAGRDVLPVLRRRYATPRPAA